MTESYGSREFRAFHSLVRGLALVNLVLVLLDSGVSPRSQAFTLRNQLVAPLFCWVVASTLLMIVLVTAQFILRVRVKRKSHQEAYL
jgi:hypothetical protein